MTLSKKLTHQALDLLAMTPDDTEARLETLESAILLLECAAGRVNVALGNSPVIPAHNGWTVKDMLQLAEDGLLPDGRDLVIGES